MYRYALWAVALVAIAAPTGQCLAVTAKDKMETCKFGADDQKLQGAARDAFMKKCMANRDDPRGSGAPAPQAAPPKQ